MGDTKEFAAHDGSQFDKPAAENKHLTKEEAIAFFSEYYYGEHHIPKHQVYEFGHGWMVKDDRGDIATWDYNGLTRLCFMAHEKCIRVGISPLSKTTLQISIWKRQREGGMSVRHPTLEEAIESFRKSK